MLQARSLPRGLTAAHFAWDGGEAYRWKAAGQLDDSLQVTIFSILPDNRSTDLCRVRMDESDDSSHPQRLLQSDTV